ncbi:MAG: GAF domain-containing protein, partial [Phototrophicaceae bacterium]
MNLKQTLFTGRSPRRLTVILAFAITLLTPIIIVHDLQMVDLQPVMAITWAICLFLFVLSDMLAGPVEDGLWAGYLYVAMTVAWLLLGPGLALLLIVVGAAVTVALRRWPLAVRRVEAPHVPHPTWQALARVSILGSTLLLISVVHTLLAGYHPHSNVQVTTASGLAAVLTSLVIGLALTQVAGAVLSGPDAARRALWRPGERHRITGEVLLLVIVVPLAIIHQRAGWVVFCILMAGAGLQAMRYRQIARTQEQLVARMQELSMLNKVGQNISANLMLEDVLLSVYDWVSQLTPMRAFYIALHDSNRDIVEFPLVMIEGQRQHWPVRPLEDDTLPAAVLRKRTIFRVDRLRAAEEGCPPHDLPFDEAYRYCLGIPLATGNKILGMMAIINDDARPVRTRPEIPALEAIANQASLALRNATLYHRSVNLAENLALINQSVQDIMFNLNQ